MSITHCLSSAVEQKAISQHMADELDVIYNRFREQFALTHGNVEAARLAKEELAKRLEGEAVQKRRAALLQAAAIETTHKALAGYKNARGATDYGGGIIELLESFGRRDEGLSTGSVNGLYKATFASFVEEFETSLDALDKNILGRRKNRAMADNIVRELHGKGTGDEAAKNIATVFARLAESARQLFNEAGGAIPKLEGWAMPQSHNAQAIRNVGKEEYIRRTMDYFAWDKMRHALSGTPILPAERAEVLGHVFDTVDTAGWFDQAATTKPQGRGALYKQHADHRFLIFKDAESALAYSRDFGQPDVLATMMGYFKGMSRDIAAMRILGPNPEATLTFHKQTLEIEAAKAAQGKPALVPRESELLGLSRDNVILKGRSPQDRARLVNNRVDAMWASYSGAADVVVDNATSAAFTTVRNAITASSLGSAILSAPSDMGFGAVARSFAHGASVPGSVFGQLGTLIKGIADHFTGAEGNRAQALRAGIHFEHLANVTGERAREANLISGPVMSRYMADQVLRKQGLVAWTSALRDAAGLEFMGAFADEIGKRWDDLKPQLRRSLERYGLGKAEWSVIQAAKLHDQSADGAGAFILRPREIAAMGVSDLFRISARDARDQNAARAALAAINGQVWQVSRDVAEIAASVIETANGAWLNKTQLQAMIGRRIFGVPDNAVPKALRDRLMSPLASRAELFAFLRDIADGGVARNEVARIRWREGAEFQALPEWIKGLFSSPETTLGDVRRILGEMTSPTEYGPRDAPPSIPSDPSHAKVQRYFRDIADRYRQMIIQEISYHVPEGTLRSRSYSSTAVRGTFGGEMQASMAQFKGYGMGVAELWGGRVANEMAMGRAGWRSWPYAAGIAFMMMGYGLLSMQMKQVSKGEDLLDMTDWRVLFKALVQSGGAGIYGDFFLADQNRLGGGIASTVAGPLVGRVEKLAKVSLGNVQQAAATNQETNAGREAVSFLQGLDPTSSLFWTKLASDRMLWTHAKRLADPHAWEAARRRAATAKRDRGTGFFWPELEPAPVRGIEMGSTRGR